jgi:hypothetical protein
MSSNVEPNTGADCTSVTGTFAGSHALKKTEAWQQRMGFRTSLGHAGVTSTLEALLVKASVQMDPQGRMRLSILTREGGCHESIHGYARVSPAS